MFYQKYRVTRLGPGLSGDLCQKKSILGKKCDTSRTGNRNKAKLIASSWFFHFHIRIEISKNEVLQVEFFEFSNEKLKFSNHEVMNIQV